MSRQLRLESPVAIYHVMIRGDRREPIFHADADRKWFVTTLGEARYFLTNPPPKSFAIILITGLSLIRSD